ncbi:YdhR family protein [bacterium]|nr:YdhR family protein [bacterium]
MAIMLFVRIKSELESEELVRRATERRPQFLEVPGLIQKIYGLDPKTGDACGVYFFEDQASLDAFRATELAKSIPIAYEAVDVRPEAYEVLFPLRPDRGPIAE